MYNTYLSQENDNQIKAIKLPINPLDELEIKIDIDNKTYKVLGLGEINKPGTKGLKKFDIKSFFPHEDDPDYYVSIIERFIDSGKPIRFILNKYQNRILEQDVNMLVLIDCFKYKDVAGELGDIYYTLQLREYKEFRAKVI